MSSQNPSSTPRKRKRVGVNVALKEEMDDPEEPASPAKLLNTLSGMAYDSIKTRTRSKRTKMEGSPLLPKAELQSLSHAPTESSEPSASKPALKKRAPSAPRKQKPVQMELQVPHDPPPAWQETYALIKEMRKDIKAPVDTMGCAQAMIDEKDPKSHRFGTLISLMLSSQTKDEVTATAVNNLRSAIGLLTVENVIATPESVIQDAINKVGFWRRKSGYIKQTAQKLQDEFDSDVPQTVDELCSLPGVGPKMAFLTLQVAWNLNFGIGVDVHVHRITNRLGWHIPPTATPEQTRLNLQSWLPKEYHADINPLLVGFGQVICLPVGPKCGACLLSSRGLCPSAQQSKVKRRKRASSVKQEDSVLGDGIDQLQCQGPEMVGKLADGLPKIEIKLEEEDSIKAETSG